MSESNEAKIARIDANVKTLLQTLPVIETLKVESAINKREHKILFSVGAAIGAPLVMWVCKRLGVLIF